jgi:hypothetical protein
LLYRRGALRNVILQVLFISLSSASIAFAVGEQDPNMLGWYFDTDATYWAADVAFEPQEVYLILTNPTVGEIEGWEASFAIEGSAALLNVEVWHDGLNSLDGQSFSVRYPSPLACEGPTVLASITLFPSALEDNCIMLYGVEAPATPSELPVLYLTGGEYLQTDMSVFEDSNASAWFGVLFGWSDPLEPYPYPCAGVTAQDAVSWSSLKRLFE